MTVEELSAWLIEEGLAEFSRGYGQACGDDMAEKLLAKFNITLKTADHKARPTNSIGHIDNVWCRICGEPITIVETSDTSALWVHKKERS